MSWQFHSETPVYLQIFEKLRTEILNGVYPPDSQIPTVRQIAYEASVNPNTVQRALVLLEGDGLLYTRGTAGHFVTSDPEKLALAREKLCQDFVRKILLQSKTLGISRDELMRCLSEDSE